LRSGTSLIAIYIRIGVDNSGRKIFFQCGRKYNKNFSVSVNAIRKEKKTKGKKVVPKT